MKNFFLIFLLGFLLVSCSDKKSDALDLSLADEATLVEEVASQRAAPDARPCDVKMAQSKAEECSLALFSESDFLTLYSIRDNVLSLSSKGQDYVTMYYEISEYIADENLYASCQDFSDNYHQVHLDGIQLAWDLINPTFHGVLIDQDMSDRFLEVSNILRATANASEITPTLDVLEKDLEELEGKDASYVRSFF